MKTAFKKTAPATKYLLILFVLLAIFVKFFQLSYRSFSLDELYSISAALEPNFNVAFENWIAYDSNPPLYNLFLRIWLQVAPATEFWVRLPSVIFILLASCFFIIGIRKRFINDTWRYLLLLLGCNFGFLFFAQEARAYALLFLFTCLQLLYFIDILKLKKFQNPWKKLIPFILMSVLSCYTHYTGIVFTIILFITLLYCTRSDINRIKQLMIGILICFLFGLFWLKYTLFLFQIDTSFLIDHRLKIWFEIVAMLLFGYATIGKYVSILFSIGIGFFSLGLFINFRTLNQVNKVLCTIALVSLTLIAFSPIIPLFFQYRHYVILIPILLLFFSIVLAHYKLETTVFNTMLIFGIVIIVSQGATFYQSKREEWRQAVNYVVTSNNGKKSKVIILAEPWEKSHQFYLKTNPGYLNISIRRPSFYKYYFERFDNTHQLDLIVLQPETKRIENYINSALSNGEHIYLLSHAGEFDNSIKKLKLNAAIHQKERRFYLHEVFQFRKE